MEYYNPEQIKIALKKYIKDNPWKKIQDIQADLNMSKPTYYAIMNDTKRRIRDDTIENFRKVGLLK